MTESFHDWVFHDSPSKIFFWEIFIHKINLWTWVVLWLGRFMTGSFHDWVVSWLGCMIILSWNDPCWNDPVMKQPGSFHDWVVSWQGLLLSESPSSVHGYADPRYFPLFPSKLLAPRFADWEFPPAPSSCTFRPVHCCHNHYKQQSKHRRNNNDFQIKDHCTL